MKKMLMLIVLLMVSSASVVFAVDCRIVSKKQLSPDSTREEWKIIFSLDDIRGGQLFFKGQRAPNNTWIEYPATIVNGLGEVVIQNWLAGESIEFSYYTRFNGVDRWTDPGCSAFEYNGHFRLVLGKKFEPKYIPAINMLLMKGNGVAPPPLPPIHECVVVSVQKTATNGVYGDYRITLSLQKFDGAPANAVPYVDHQPGPDLAWTGYYPITRQGDVASFTIGNWPSGNPVELSYKLVLGAGEYWQDLNEWSGSCATNYIYNGHIRIMLN